MVDNTNSLAHTKWNCKYRIVFAPKYRRKVFFGEKKVEIGKILRQLCEWKGIKIIEAEICPDHVHMLLEIPPKVAVSSFMGYLKGKSSLHWHAAQNIYAFGKGGKQLIVQIVPVGDDHNGWVA